jgi:hypothetical protein
MLYWVYYTLLSHGSVWLFIILTVMTVALPDLIIEVVQNMVDSFKLRKHVPSQVEVKRDSNLTQNSSQISLAEKSLTEVSDGSETKIENLSRSILKRYSTNRDNKVEDSSSL